MSATVTPQFIQMWHITSDKMTIGKGGITDNICKVNILIDKPWNYSEMYL